jgi:hypothetical protein
MPSPVPPSPADLAAAADRTIPDVLAIAGVTAYRTAFARPRAAIGPQPDPLGTTPVWGPPPPQRPQRLLDPAPPHRSLPRAPRIPGTTTLNISTFELAE